MTASSLCVALRGEGIEVRDQPGVLASYETDFGRLVRGRAAGAIVPRSPSEVARTIVLARAHDVGLTPRGGGWSQSGQSVADDTMSIDLSALRAIDGTELDAHRITVEAAVTLRDVFAATLPRGLALPVSPLNLDLTVGGVLAAGGMGSSTHRCGLVVDHVERVEVVLGTGEIRSATPERHRDVYDAVLGGLGRAGVVTRATLRLVPSPEMLRTTVVLHRELAAALAHQERLAARPEIAHLDLMCAPAMLGLARAPDGSRVPLRRFLFALHVSTAIDVAPTSWSEGAEILHDERDDAASFAARFDGRFRVMRATGAWDQPHPWFEAFVPRANVQVALERAMALPPFLAELVRATPIAEPSSLRPHGLAMPEGPASVVAILPSGVPPAFVEAARAAIADLDDAFAELGAKRYLSGWLPRIVQRGWREHYGERLDAIASTVARSDPARVFRSKLPGLDVTT